MKRIASISLILLMSFQCFYKLGLISYFELNRDYIAEMLCINREKPITTCYGKCFLEKEFDLANDEHSNNGTLPAGKQRGDLPIFLITETYHSVQEIQPTAQNNSRYLLNTSSAHYTAPFHPPALLS